MTRRARGPRVLVITGLSGSGKTHVSRALEDAGWFCVDNLPIALIPSFVELVRRAPAPKPSALVVDVREPELVRRFPEVFARIKKGARGSLLFLEADERALVRRFSETRRPHPLAVNQPVIEGIREEREALRPIRKMADLIVDTSAYTVHQLRDYVRDHFALREQSGRMVLAVMSFGYKFGVPVEADLVFDLRFLPNPNFVPRLKPLTGRHPKVVSYLRRQPETGTFLGKLARLLSWVIPRYEREGKSYLTIAVGCTGGRHRSVMVADALGKALAGRDRSVRVYHRDVRQS
jgi:UPF0042 nucleotide-binding protein